MSGLHHKSDHYLWTIIIIVCIYSENCSKKKKTYVTGNLRSNCKHNLNDIIRQKIKKGEFICRCTEGGICVVKWNDK